MSDRAEMAERHGRILAELAELGLSLARDVHARAEAAETPEQTATLATAFHRLTRGVRQTLALEARLERDRVRADREDHAEAVRAEKQRASRRYDQVKAAVERLIWTEAEGEDAEQLLADLEDHLDAETLSDDFGQDPLDRHIAKLAKNLGLPDPPPQGEVSPKATEGVEAHQRPAPQPPHPLRGSSPSGGASHVPDPPPQGEVARRAGGG